MDDQPKASLRIESPRSSNTNEDGVVSIKSTAAAAKDGLRIGMRKEINEMKEITSKHNLKKKKQDPDWIPKQMKYILRKPANRRKGEEIEFLSNGLAATDFFLQRKLQINFEDLKEISSFL